jgi:hypothetical protein
MSHVERKMSLEEGIFYLVGLPTLINTTGKFA